MRGKGKKVGGEESDDNWRPFGWDAGDALKCAEEAVRIATGGGNVENLKRYLGTGEQGQDFDRWRLAAALQLADMMLCCVAAEVSKSEDEVSAGIASVRHPLR